MRNRRQLRRVLIAATLVASLVPSSSFSFVESTETKGELPTNIGGIWLVVTHIEFPKPTPTPEAGSSPAPTPVADAAGAAVPTRYFNVLNLMRFVHIPKDTAQAMRAADKKMEEASIEKAKAILAEEQKKSIPVQTETGEVAESEAKVVVPAIPPRRQPGDGDDVDIFLLDVAFPKSIQDAVDKAQKDEKPWVPNDKDLALLKSSWSTLKPSGRDEYSKIEWVVTSADKFDENLQIDPVTKEAKFVISGNQEMIPKPNVPKTNIVVFGVYEAKNGTMSGKHTRAMMASSPFPLPIEMKGSFKAYKIAELPSVAADKAVPAPAKTADKAMPAPAKKPVNKH